MGEGLLPLRGTPLLPGMAEHRAQGCWEHPRRGPEPPACNASPVAAFTGEGYCQKEVPLLSSPHRRAEGLLLAPGKVFMCAAEEVDWMQREVVVLPPPPPYPRWLHLDLKPSSLIEDKEEASDSG